MPLLSLVALTRQSWQGRKPNVRTPPFHQLTAVSRLLSPTSDVTLRRGRRQHACFSLIPRLQYPCGSLGAGNQTRTCLSRVFGKQGCPNKPCSPLSTGLPIGHVLPSIMSPASAPLGTAD